MQRRRKNRRERWKMEKDGYRRRNAEETEG